jgi:predicted sulfurtransferase
LKFVGKNFVFDGRMGERITDDVIAKCHQCGAPCDNHTTCNNDGCHLLFIQCDGAEASMRLLQRRLYGRAPFFPPKSSRPEGQEG